MNRRAVLASTAGLVSMAGCLSDDGPDHEYERGDIEIVIDGDEFDLSADRFQSEHADDYSMNFHLHEMDDHWYNDYPESGERITFAEGIDLLPEFAYEEADGEHAVTIDDTEYDGREDDTELTFFVDDEQVDPTEHAVRDGDSLRLEITTGA
ncbi:MULTISPECIES: hypothetical protein [Natronorubrum]|uniref:Uncharacterized protein n=2 Tax=Natronorubrum bangense TaxID=61858 RepID=L9WLS5_9EURY|nr:hypothetical protein [Natronorubrum bangense]ELY50332.1 hypothetical protein C494_05983 [Natronorubrum bangense JCM 10635]QCC54229.1 hypothetical protein DV706_06845 [Natronorubrum bangense]